MNLHKIFLASLIILCCVATQYSRAAGEGRSKEVVPGVYAITDLSFSNSGFIVTDAGVVVVDTQLVPMFANEIIKEINAITDKPIKYAINTHWHTDHVGGNEAFHPQASIIAHDSSVAVIRAETLWFTSHKKRFSSVAIFSPKARGFLITGMTAILISK
jgi:glyoxylase-like metal-dependent hydrolase (beta-lactamase superfamily II)